MSGQDEGDQAAIQAAEPSAADMDQDVEYFGFSAQIRIHVCSNTHTHTKTICLGLSLFTQSNWYCSGVWIVKRLSISKRQSKWVVHDVQHGVANAVTMLGRVCGAGTTQQAAPKNGRTCLWKIAGNLWKKTRTRAVAKVTDVKSLSQRRLNVLINYNWHNQNRSSQRNSFLAG